MKKILLFSYILLGSLTLQAQLTPNGNSGSSTTAYTNGSANDPIYIWCAEGIGNNTASLTAVPTNGTGPWTFKWYFHNQTTASWDLLTTQTGSTSTVNNLASDGYRVQIYDAGNTMVNCHTAWVWNMNTNISASQSPASCNSTNLQGALTVEGAFSYYNPPPPESIITSSTQINVCFSATHTWVSDLAFYLIGPGGQTIVLSPNPGSLNTSNNICNSNNNVNNLCFSSASTNTFNPCDEQCCGFLCTSTTTCTSNYTGTYGRYSPGTSINWSALYGVNAAQGGWKVQIFDCITNDVGALTNASVTFSNLNSGCGGATTINYNSGTINSAINDNSCTAGTASIFQVPASTALTTPITINANVSYLWTANTAASIPTPSSSLTPTVTNVPNGNNTFTLTSTATYANASCSFNKSANFNSGCCTINANAGADVSFCSGGSAQIGTVIPGVTYSWSPATGLSDATVAQPTVTLTNTTAAPVVTVYTLTIFNPLDNTCTSTDEVSVTVNPTPVVNAGTYAAVCVNAPNVVLAGTPAGGTFSGTGVSGTNFSPASGTQVITYNYTNANNCSNSATTTITVNNLPVVNAGTDQNICTGASVTLNGSGAATYAWNNSVTNGVPFSPAATATYQVTGTDANGCVNTDQVVVTINPVPTVQVQNALICPGESTTIVATPSPSGGTYLWSTSETTASISVSPTQTSTYNLVYTLNGCNSLPATSTITVKPTPTINAGADQSICIGAQVTLNASSSTTFSWSNGISNGVPFSPTTTTTYIATTTDASQCINTDQVTVTVNPLPNIQAGPDLSICLNEVVTLTGSGGVSYSWSNGVQNGVSFNPGLGTFNYTVTGTDANGCVNTDQVTVNVLPVPVADFIADAYEGYSVFTVNFSQNASGGNSYVWDFGNGLSITSSSPVNSNAVYTNVGTYTVTLSAHNGVCSTLSSALITVLPYPDAEIIVPNVFTPNGDNANDYFALKVKYGATIHAQIFNRWGNLMTELNNFDDKWDGDNASPGVYFITYRITDLNGKEYTGHGHVTLEK